MISLLQQGFGNIDGEYWLGLENIYWLTSQDNYKLLVTLEDWTGRKTFAEYASFRVESENDFYRLRVGRYHGNAGDSLTWHNGKQFTTLDRDHDVYAGEGNAMREKAVITLGWLSLAKNGELANALHHAQSPAVSFLSHTTCTWSRGHSRTELFFEFIFSCAVEILLSPNYVVDSPNSVNSI